MNLARFLCMTPGCGGMVERRGLCSRCYQRALTAVHSGKTTWQQLVADGKAAAPKERVGRKKPHWHRRS